MATRSHPGATLARAARRRRSPGVPSWRRSLSGSDEPTPGCRVALFRFPPAPAVRGHRPRALGDRTTRCSISTASSSRRLPCDRTSNATGARPPWVRRAFGLESQVPDLRIELIFNAGAAWHWFEAPAATSQRAAVLSCIGMRGSSLAIQQPGRLILRSAFARQG